MTALGEVLRSVAALDINLIGYCETVDRDRLEIAKHCAQAAVRAINREMQEPSIKKHPLVRNKRAEAMSIDAYIEIDDGTSKVCLYRQRHGDSDTIRDKLLHGLARMDGLPSLQMPCSSELFAHWMVVSAFVAEGCDRAGSSGLIGYRTGLYYPCAPHDGTGDSRVWRVDLMTGTIRGVNGEFYPCKPDIFNKTCEPVARAE